MYTPAEPEQDSVEDPAGPRVKLVAERLQARPEVGDTLAARLIVPVNP